MNAMDRMPFDFPQSPKDLSENIIKVIGYINKSENNKKRAYFFWYMQVNWLYQY